MTQASDLAYLGRLPTAEGAYELMRNTDGTFSWVTAPADTFVTSGTFNTSTRVLTLTRNDAVDVIVTNFPVDKDLASGLVADGDMMLTLKDGSVITVTNGGNFVESVVDMTPDLTLMMSNGDQVNLPNAVKYVASGQVLAGVLTLTFTDGTTLAIPGFDTADQVETWGDYATGGFVQTIDTGNTDELLIEISPSFQTTNVFRFIASLSSYTPEGDFIYDTYNPVGPVPGTVLAVRSA